MEIYHPLMEEALTRLEEIGKLQDEEYRKRFEVEALEIEKQGMWDYFADLAQSRRKLPNENHLLFAFLLGISIEDPVEGGQDLEWVQSNDFPDIDTDFLPDDRDLIKSWASERFGEDRVCSICNYSTYQTKSAIQDVARVFDIPAADVRELTTKMDNDVNKMDWEVAIETYPQLKKFEESYPEVCEVVRKLRGRHYRLGAHAAGIVISDRPLTDVVPLVQREGRVMSAWAEGQATSDLKTVGLVKFDILGLENLNYIKTASEMIHDVWRTITFDNGHSVELERWNDALGVQVDDLEPGDRFRDATILSIEPVEIDFSDEHYLDDKKSLEMANQGDLVGVFQFDSKGIREIARQIGIHEFEDLVSATCLFRPGPLDSGMVTEFVKRRQGQIPEEEKEIHPILQEVMGKTEGIALYQEQTMQIFNVVGGISLPNCEKIRKAMGQKRVSEFLKFKDEFLETGSKRLGWPKLKKEARPGEKSVEEFWEKIEKSSGYLFNRSHGVVYTIVSMQCLYLKAHYPREYFAAVLSHLGPGDDRRSLYMKEARKLGVEFVPVDINKSGMGFTIREDGRVYFGFDKIKGVGAQAEKLVKLQPFASFEDFIERYGVGKRVCEPLIKLGAFDRFHPNRKALFEAYLKHHKQKNRKNKEEVKVEDCDPFTPREICEFEGKYYGLFFNHPLSARQTQGYTTEKVPSMEEIGKVEVYIKEIKEKKTRKGNSYFTLYTEDEYGSLPILLWEDQYDRYSRLLEAGECYRIDIIPPKKYPTANVPRDGKIVKLAGVGEATEEEVADGERGDEFQTLLQTLKFEEFTQEIED